MRRISQDRFTQNPRYRIIRQAYFHEHGKFVFEIRKRGDAAIAKMEAKQLFHDDKWLQNFALSDIRRIAYCAIFEDTLLNQPQYMKREGRSH